MIENKGPLHKSFAQVLAVLREKDSGKLVIALHLAR